MSLYDNYVNVGFVVNGITNANTTTWEVRYGFSSTEVSLITVFYDIAAGLLVLPITYFGANAHQMRILSISALIMGCGSIVMCIPHWSAGIYNIGEQVKLHCDILGTATVEHSCALMCIIVHILVGVCVCA